MSNPFDQFDAQPRGLRNNNPLNITGQGWDGQTGSDAQFAQFATPEAGRAAADANLKAYHRKHGINTVAGVVSRWAPPTENDTGSYVANVSSKLGVDPNAPIDMEDPAMRGQLLDAMQQHETGQPAPSNPFDQFDGGAASAAAPQSVGRPAGSNHNGGVMGAPQRPPGAAQVPTRRDQGLGFQKGVMKPMDNSARGLEWLASTVGLDKPINALGAALGLPSNQQVAASREAGLAAQKAKGVLPGRLGEFAGNMVGTLPLSALPGGVLAQGAGSGALLSDAKDAAGVVRDAAIGAVSGKVAQKAIGAIGAAGSNLLAKAPKIMSLPELEAAKRAAYKAVDASGFVFPKADAKAAASNVQAFLAKKGGRDLYPEASLWVTRLTNLANQKGGLPLSQLDDLRGDIYTALVKGGGKDSVVGSHMRGEIDKLISSASKENALIRDARDLNQRWSKARLVNNKAKSGELRAEKDYGGDFGRKVKDRVFPLIDPDNAKANLRGATPDEIKALTRLATGTKTQNLASTVGGMLDPRRLGGKIVAGLTTTGGGAGAIPSGGLSLLLPATQMAAGFGLTGTASSIARRNVDDLLKLIAVGGSRQALKKVPTAASQAATRAAAKVAPVSGLIGGTLAAQAHRGR